MKEVLINENTERANQRIAQIEENYLSVLQSISTGIISIGLKPDASLLSAVTERNFEPLEKAISEMLEADAAMFKSPQIRDEIKSTYDIKLKEIKGFVEQLHSPVLFNRVSFQEKDVEGLFDLDDSGIPYISEEKREMIRESFREYITDPERIKIYNLHQEVAKKLDTFMKSLKKVDMLGNGYMPPTFLIMSFFEVKDDGDTLDIKPKRLNYNI